MRRLFARAHAALASARPKRRGAAMQFQTNWQHMPGGSYFVKARALGTLCPGPRTVRSRSPGFQSQSSSKGRSGATTSSSWSPLSRSLSKPLMPVSSGLGGASLSAP